jgi:hypothetical protein
MKENSGSLSANNPSRSTRECGRGMHIKACRGSEVASFPGSPSPFLTFFFIFCMCKYYTRKIFARAKNKKKVRKGEGEPGNEARSEARETILFNRGATWQHWEWVQG